MERDVNDSELLQSKIKYASYRRPVLRPVVLLALLLPVLVHGLETDADRLVLLVLGGSSAALLLYAAYRAGKNLDLGKAKPALVGLLAVSSVVALGAVMGTSVGDRETALWPVVVALGVAMASAMFVMRKADPWRRESITAPPLPSGYESSIKPAADTEKVDFSGDAIACSGGGIRAAAFCLGGLQRLRTAEGGQSRSYYDGATRVFAVSGGGYIATALHLARINSPADAQTTLFAPGSPEEDWLRRKSRYLLPSGALVSGLLNLVYGIAVNLALIGLLLFAASWYAGWFHNRLGGVCGDEPLGGGAECLTNGTAVAAWTPEWIWTGVDGGWNPLDWNEVNWDWAALTVSLLVLPVGLLLFAASKAISKYAPRGSLPFIAGIRVLVVAGAGLAVLAAVLPWLVVNLNNATIESEPTPVVARAMAASGLATPEACTAATRASFERQAVLAWERASDREDEVPFSYGACGEEWTDDAAVFAPGGTPLYAGVSDLCEAGVAPRPSYCDDTATTGISGWEQIGAWAAVLAAGLAAVRGLMRGLGGGAGGGTGRIARLADGLRSVVLPWTALVLLIAVIALIFLVLTRDNLVDPERLEPHLWWVLIPLGAVAIRVLTDAIISSLHPFYRERLSDTFLIKRADDKPVPFDYRDPTHVFTSAAWAGPPFVVPGPELTICCAANLTDPDYIPAARGCASFLFETGHGGGCIGISDSRLPSGRRRAAEPYSAASEPAGFDTTLAAAMATSGAAFSPLAGRQSRRLRPYRVLLALVNARLGVWLPNPYLVEDGDAARGVVAPGRGDWRDWRRVWARAMRPGPYRLYKEAFGALSIYDARIYVTDGGHYDNTGIVEALRSRPRRLVVLDASADLLDSLDALGDAIVTARMDLGLLIKPAGEDDFAKLKGKPNKDTKGYDRPAQGWVQLTVRTVEDPDTVVCDIWFVKNVLTPKQGIELDTYAAENPAFPSTTTVNQFYGEYDFEAYRLLGYTNTAKMMEDMVAGASVTAV